MKQTPKRSEIFADLIRHSLRQNPTAILSSTAQFLLWNARFALWKGRCRFLPSTPANLPQSTAILLSYNRPFNINGIVRSLLQCGFVKRIIVSNNNPDIDLNSYLRVSSPRIELLQQKERKGCGYRFHIARENPSEHYLCLDDDVFVSPEILHRLQERHCAFPESPCGTVGFDVRWELLRQGYPHPINRKRNQDASVDVLNHIYFFSAAHVVGFFSHLEELVRIDPSYAQCFDQIDDILLSTSGQRRSRLWKVGNYIPCPSGMASAISMHGRPGIKQVRMRALSILRERYPKSLLD